MRNQQFGYIAAVQKRFPRNRSSLVSSSRRLSEVYRAMAAMPWAREHVPVVYKIFVPEIQGRGLFNEIFCFHLARALGYSVPRDVCLCPCRKSQLLGPSRCLENRDPDSEWLPGVASVDLNTRGVTRIIGGTRLLDEEILAWPDAPRTAVFDELVYNVDRNIGNLFRTGKANFSLIDHEKAFGGPDWTLETLAQRMTKPSTRNYLANHISDSGNRELANKMVAVASQFASHLTITEEWLGVSFEGLDQQCHLKSGTTERVVDLLNQRVPMLPEAMFYHLRAAELFGD